MMPLRAAKALDLFTATDRNSLECPALRVTKGDQWWEATDGHALIRICLGKAHHVSDIEPGVYRPEVAAWRRFAQMPEKWRAPDLTMGPLAAAKDWPNTDHVWTAPSKAAAERGDRPHPEPEAAPLHNIGVLQLDRLVKVARALVGKPSGLKWGKGWIAAPPKEPLGAWWLTPAFTTEDERGERMHVEVLVMPMRFDACSPRAWGGR